MNFLKTIAGQIVGGVVALGVIALGITWWRMDPETHHAIVSASGRILAWLGVVIVLPWASFFVIGRIAKLDCNAAGATLVAAYTLVEIVLLAWLFHWTIPNATAWTFVILGGLFSAAYNLFACDWIAEKVG